MAKSPTLDVTISTIRNRITRGEFKASGVLPSIQTLATQANVSLVTAWKAIQVLKNEGLIRGKRGMPLTITQDDLVDNIYNTDKTSVDFNQPKLKWLQIAAWMRTDLLSGTYRPGAALPTIKELQRRYNVSHPTLRKTLNLLTTEGILQRCLSGYQRASGGTGKAGQNRILLITRVEALGRMFSGVLFAEFLRCLEYACREAQVTLEITAYRIEDDLPVFIRWPSGEKIQLGNIGEPLGVVYAPESYWEEQESIALELVRSKAPLAIFDDSGEWKFSPRLLDRPLVRVFRLGIDTYASCKVAQYLIDLGHKRIVYFSAHHASQWSKKRLSGLIDTFENAGYKNSVSHFVLDALPVDFIGTTRKKTPGDNFISMYESWKSKAPNAYVKQFEPLINRLLIVESAHAHIREQMQPLFEKALAEKDATAWVCGNDLIAGFAIDFCKSKKINVPHTLSISGFDDSMEALNDNITSYNWNLTAIADAVVSHVLQRKNELLIPRKKIIDINGALAVRGSTGKPNICI